MWVSPGHPAARPKEARTVMAEGGIGLLERLKERAKAVCPTVVYPGAADQRIVEAAERVAREGIAKPVLVGQPEELPQSLPAVVRAERIEESERLSRLAEQYAARREVALPVARRLVERPLLYAGMMVASGEAGAMVAGSLRPSASVFQATALTVGYREGTKAHSTCFIVVVPRVGERQNVPPASAARGPGTEHKLQQLRGPEWKSSSSRTTSR